MVQRPMAPAAHKPARPAVARALIACAGGLWILGCGRPATLEDCQQIVEKVTVLELKRHQIQDPASVADYIKETQEAFKQEAKERCIGKRISDSALNCIARATDAEQVFEECLD